MPESFVVTLQGPAEQALTQAPDAVREHLLRVFEELEQNPFVDNVTKFHYTRFLPAMLNAYTDDIVRIVYQLQSHDAPNWEKWEIEVWSITY